jgi:hypothetical protein
MTLRVSSIQEITIYVEGLPPLTRKEAIQLAVQLAFLADGGLVLEQSVAQGIIRWNARSPFFVAYEEFMGTRDFS